MQLPAAHRIQRQLCTSNGADGQLPGGDHAALQRIGYGAQRNRCILVRQAIVGVVRHPHGNFHADAPGYDAHAVAEENVGERGVLPVFFGIRAIHEIHFQRDRRQVAACVKLRLRCLTHFSIALRFAFRLVAVRDFLGFRYRQMNPFRVGIGIEVRTVEIQFWQIQNIPVRVLAGGHDAGNHIRFVHIVGNAGQVLLFPDGYVGVIAHVLHQKYIVPVAGQLRTVLADQPIFTQHGFHGVYIFPFHVLSS